MTLPPRFPVCPICHGVHKVIAECLGRPQTEVEWMVDRGVEPERAYAFARARGRADLGSIVLLPDPLTIHVPPYGAPERAPSPPPAEPAPEQEALF